MSAFGDRLKTYHLLNFSTKPLDLGELPPAVDLRAGHLILNHGHACGLATAQVGAVLLAGAESNRVLHALHELLTELVEAEPEEIPARLRELIEAQEHITAHLDAALTAIEAAQKAMLAAPLTHALPKRTH